MKKIFILLFALLINTGLSYARKYYFDPVRRDWFSTPYIAGRAPYNRELLSLTVSDIKHRKPTALPTEAAVGGNFYFSDELARWVYEEK